MNKNTQLDFFCQALPKKPYCSDNLEFGLKIRNRGTALKHKLIQVNPPWLRSYLVFDLDYAGAGLAWEDHCFPPPAWSSVNPENGHAHLAWSLNAPVLLGKMDRVEPMRYLAAVEGCMSAKLDADPGYSGLVTKNPIHPHWKTLWGKDRYDLAYLSEFVDLQKYRPYRNVRPELTGIGRNVDSFDIIRKYAYRNIRSWKVDRYEKGIYVTRFNHLYRSVKSFTGNEHPTPLDHRECYSIAKSVAHWVWTRFDIGASDARFSRRQAARGCASGHARRAQTEGLRAEALRLRNLGLSIRAIASELRVSVGAVHKWCSPNHNQIGSLYV